MTKHQERWTKEQVEALWASVKKYGVGKWQVILSDPQFGPALSNRSNIDLKVYFISPCYYCILLQSGIAFLNIVVMEVHLRRLRAIQKDSRREISRLAMLSQKPMLTKKIYI